MGTLKKLTILVLILAVPGFLYYLLTAKGKNRYKPLSIYGPKIVAKTTHKGFHGAIIPDTIYHVVDDFNLTDQEGKPVTLKSYPKKVIVISFFYTHCKTVCNVVNGNMDSLAHQHAGSDMVQFVSITVDPMRDSAPVLKSYAAQFGVSSKKWSFLTGDTSMIYGFARKSLLVNAVKAGPGADDFIYSDKIIMLDASGRIRGYYSGTSNTDIARLNDEIRVQITEELRKVETPEM